LSLRISRWISLTLAYDGSVWCVVAWSHLRGKPLRPPSPQARSQLFHSWEAAAEFFRARYRRALPLG
jgi:hypothetical protein